MSLRAPGANIWGLASSPPSLPLPRFHRGISIILAIAVTPIIEGAARHDTARR